MILRRRHRIEQADLQGNVLCGYGNDFGVGRYMIVTFEEPAAGRRFLGELAEQVTTALPWGDRPKPLHALNAALSYEGLRALGVPPAIRDKFAEAFCCGMMARADKLGDTGRSAPGNWEEKLRDVESHHLLLSLMARDACVLAERVEMLERRIREDPAGLAVAYRQDVRLLPHTDDDIPVSREHFGFADGFSQPAIKGVGGPHDKKGMGTRRRFGKWRPLALGEFVLGYPGADKLLQEAPFAPLAHNGSYTVFRKLYQDVYEFDCYLEEHRDLPGLEGTDHEQREQLAAKMVGRWTDGRSLVKSRVPTGAAELERHPWYRRHLASLVKRLRRSEQAQQSHLYRNFVRRVNKFDYASDPKGFGCPLGAHVRRANPRDSMGWQGRLTMRHRIIRRSMPYGDPPLGRRPLRAPPGDVKAYNGDRGLVFICHQASIERQFELIQSQWLNDGDIFWLGDEKDFLAAGRQPEVAAVGGPGGPAPAGSGGRFESGPAFPKPAATAEQHEPAAVVVAMDPATQEPDAVVVAPEAAPRPGRMTIQGRPPRFLEPQPYFVQLRGGGYYFTPGLAALRALAHPYWL
jgi:Dyp-type peroxidase family